MLLFKKKNSCFHGYSVSVPQQSNDMLNEDSSREASEENYDEEESDQSPDN